MRSEMLRDRATSETGLINMLLRRRIANFLAHAMVYIGALCLFCIGAPVIAVDHPANPIGLENARHLLSRTAFFASEDDITKLSRLNRRDAAHYVTRAPDLEQLVPPPAWVVEKLVPPRKLQEGGRSASDAYLKLNNERVHELRSWWVSEMLQSRTPLSEKMTLFWHNHFATSQEKVSLTPLLYLQNKTIRLYGMKNFGILLREMARDPALLVYLDGINSKKEAPNENFAREVFELFSLGQGSYSEIDVRDAARAFTGWTIDRDSGNYFFQPESHDVGEKTILGKTGNFTGEQVIDLILQRPETAVFIVRKLWREFVSPHPNEAVVTYLANQFRFNQYDVAQLMQSLLETDEFYAFENRGTLIKSPIELLVGIVKTLGLTEMSPLTISTLASELGQGLFTPPNVKGWLQNEGWINSASLLRRKQILHQLFNVEPCRSGAAVSMEKLVPLDFDLLDVKSSPNNDLPVCDMAGAFKVARAVAKSSNRVLIQQIMLPIAPVNIVFSDLPDMIKIGGNLAKKYDELTPEEALGFVKNLALDPVYQLK